MCLLALLLGAAGDAQAGAVRLETSGRSEAWLAATAEVRQRLGSLDLSSREMQRWRPAIEQRCAVLAGLPEVSKSDKVLFVDVFAGMLEDLAQGREPFVRYAGKTLAYGYWSEHMQRIEGHKLFVPPGYDPAKEYQLFVYYKMGGGGISDWANCGPPWRPEGEMCAKAPDTFHVWSNLSTQVKGRMGAEVELQELSAALTADFSISPDRVFLSGFSDGGFTALWLGSHYPHLVAGIAPEVANWQYTNVEVAGLSNVPMLMVDGWFDGGYLESNFIRLFALDSLGYADIASMVGQHNHDTVPFEDERYFLKIMEWARSKRRNLYPKQVRYATWSLQWHQVYWVSIERMVEPALVARIEAAVKEDNTIEVTAKNVAAYALSLSDKLVDLTRPVRVLTNGKTSYLGPFRPALKIEVVRLPESRYAKTPETDGDILAAVDRDLYHERPQVPGRPWLWVRPTGGTQGQREALASHLPAWAVDDVKVTEAQLRTCSLYLFGGPGLNRLADRIARELPVRFAQGRFSIGEKVYDQPDQWVKFIHPNPFNPQRSVIVYGFNDPVAAAKRDFWGGGSKMGRESWEFRTGDCVVYGVPDPEKPFGVVLPSNAPADYFIFGPDWGAPKGRVLGVAEKPFDYLAIQQLKADALREATGAEAALIWGFTPEYLRWRAYLRRGPITVQDLATIESLPQYAMLCEVTGAQLKELVRQAPFSSVREPSDIEDGKTYTLATDYTIAASSALTYAVDPKQMPAPFVFFDSMAEFAATPAARLGSRKLRLSDVEMTKALAQYVARHRRISPRPSMGKLISYLTSPEGNFDAEQDWHHLRIAAPFRDPKTGALVSRDVFLNAGFRWEGMAQVSPTEARTKAFDRLESGPFHRDLRRLRRRPPVTVSGSAQEAHLPGDRRAQLVTVRYENHGERPLQVLLALTSPSLRAEDGGIWPEAKVEGPQPKSPHYLGFVDELTSDEKPYSRQARLVLFPDGVPKTERLMLPNAGWNTGVIGFSWESAIPAHSALTVPVLLLSLDAPEVSKPQLPDLGEVLDVAHILRQ